MKLYSNGFMHKKLTKMYFNDFSYKELSTWIIIAIPLFFLSYLHKGFQIDDALIYQRYIQNLLDGHGLVYNKGEYFNALTSPLYTYTLAGLSLIFRDVQNTMISISTIFLFLTTIIFIKIFSKSIGQIFSLLGGLFLISSPYFYFVYGMETPLFIFLIALCIRLFQKEDIFYLGIASALLIITRNEGAFLVIAMLATYIYQKKQLPALKNFIFPLIIIIVTFSFNKYYYGTFLAETGMAKIYQGQSGFWGEWPAFLLVDYQTDWFFYGRQFVIYLFLILSVIGVIAVGPTAINAIFAIFIFLHLSFYIGLNIPNYHWYYAPYYILMCFYSAAGLSLIWNQRNASKSILVNITHYIVIIGVTYLLTLNTFLLTKNRPDLGQPNVTYRDIGKWLEKNTSEDAKIALAEIGHVGFYSKRYIIDILGLVNPYNAKFIGEKKLDEWLKHYNPDYIVTHADVWKLEAGALSAVLIGDFTNPLYWDNEKFKLLKKASLSMPNISPTIRSDVSTELTLEGDNYVIMNHAPGEIRFDELEPGNYTINPQLGILKNAYTNNPQPTDGINFKILLLNKKNEETELFSKFINPRDLAEDRGVLSTLPISFNITEKASLILSTGTGPINSSSSDWSFWRNLRLKKID